MRSLINKNSQGTSRRSSRLLRFVATGLFALTILTGFSFAQPQYVQAEPSSTDQALAYCKKQAAKVSKNIVAACNDANMTKVRNIATYGCNASAKAEKKVDCVVKNAQRYINDALATKPKLKDRGAFQRAIDKVVMDSKKDPSKPAAGFGSTTSPSGSEACVKDSTGACKPCSADNPAQGCVRCNDGSCADAALSCTGDKCDLIGKYLNPTIGVLTVSFGLIAAISLILASITYISSGGDAQKVAQAKDRIAKTVFAILTYFFLYGFLQFIIPGGAFNR